MEGLNERAGESVGDPRRAVSPIRTPDARALHGNDVGTLGRSPSWSKKAGVVRWNGHSNNQGTTDVEDENAPKDTTNSLDDVATRAFGLGSGAMSESVIRRIGGHQITLTQRPKMDGV